MLVDKEIYMCMRALVRVSRYDRVPIHETIIICVCVHMFVYLGMTAFLYMKL